MNPASGASNLLTMRVMAYNNAFANHRLLNAMAPLSQAEFEAKRVNFFPSLQATMNHIFVVDLFYIDALEGGRLGYEAFREDIPYPALPDLKQAQLALDRRLVVHCDALAGPDLDAIVEVQRGSRIQRERRDRLLLHLFQHQIHHRGQAHAMLAGTAIKPPQLDEFFSIGEAPLRAAELHALGWREEDIWGRQA